MYLRLIDFVHHSTLGLRVMKKKKRADGLLIECFGVYGLSVPGFMVLGLRIEGGGSVGTAIFALVGHADGLGIQPRVG